MASSIKVFFSTPRWELSGVNTMTGRLIAGLRKAGIDARILITAWSDKDGPDLLPPPNIPFDVLPICHHLPLKRRWAPLLSVLESHGSCLFIPNYDFAAAVVSPALPSNVGIVGTIRSDEPVYFDQLARLGSYWNRVVTVSRTLKSKVDLVQPAVAERTVAISNGISLNDSIRNDHPKDGDPLRLLYTGRIVQQQKRVFDLIKVAETLTEKGVAFLMDIAGDGEDFSPFAEALTEKGLTQNVRLHGRLDSEKLDRLYQQAHLFLLVSEFEGMPNSLLEAMSWGCVPVCTRTGTGASEVIEHEVNGFLAAVGATETMATAIASLRDPVVWKAMSDAAISRIQSDFSESVMFADWAKTIESVHQEVTTGGYQRTPGPIQHVPGTDPLSVIIGQTRVKLGKWRRRLGLGSHRPFPANV